MNETQQPRETREGSHGLPVQRRYILSKAKNCPTLGVHLSCIRLATSRDGQKVYSTVGRSKGLNPQRSALSKSIPSREGIAGHLRKKAKRGCCIIRDIDAAIADELWKATDTDKLPDIRTLMVVPINGIIAGEKTMVGILYVTSAENPFRQLYIEPLMAFADLLGLVYPMITGTVKVRGVK